MAVCLYLNFLINALVKQVFDAITNPEHLNNWWPLKSSGLPELDTEYHLNLTDDYNWCCKVSRVKENKYIHFKMTK